MTPRRAQSLDAFRGLAIILMVLSSMEAFGILPSWMYHAQVPPPDHIFRPDLPGITWVDLVFPFFLFAMGAAFPFSIRRRMEKGSSKGKLCLDALLRALRLFVFAVFIEHFYPWNLGGDPVRASLLEFSAFFVMFMMFTRLPSGVPQKVGYLVKVAGYLAAIAMCCLLDFGNYPNLVENPMAFLSKSNIIILVLANMAFFASVLYILTVEKAWLRLLVLLGIGALAATGLIFDQSFLRRALDWSPVPWLYRFDFLKYLFIVIPGTLAGDCLWGWMKDNVTLEKGSRWRAWAAMTLSLVIIVMNVVCLFERYLLFNAIASVVLCAAGVALMWRSRSNDEQLWRIFMILGAVFLLIGLALEPLQGGIKKDHATFSYLFVTSGLAFYAMTFFHVLCDHFGALTMTGFLRLSGQNPMIAYSAGQMFVLPLLAIFGLKGPFLAFCGTSPWLGFFLQGVGLTTLVVLVTMFFSRCKLFWRT